MPSKCGARRPPEQARRGAAWEAARVGPRGQASARDIIEFKIRLYYILFIFCYFICDDTDIVANKAPIIYLIGSRRCSPLKPFRSNPDLQKSNKTVILTICRIVWVFVSEMHGFEEIVCENISATKEVYINKVGECLLNLRLRFKEWGFVLMI